jgi:predicted nucleotidyltransferase
LKISTDVETLIESDVISLQVIKNECSNILKNYPEISCYLFGSYAKGSPNRTSDIDLLLLFNKEMNDYKIICKVEALLKESFLAIEKYCNPIHVYKDRINRDSSILFRQYVHCGILLSGQNILPLMKNETLEELNSLEYTHYWTPMYRKKIEVLDQMITSEIDIKNTSLSWQYLCLIAYWYAKAELTLVNKQNSLNNFSLLYIYEDLLGIHLNFEQKQVLDTLQKQRENYRNGEYFEIPNISVEECFIVLKSLVLII